MSEIAELYNQVMSGEQDDMSKVAADAGADQGQEFNADFFEKVAGGDEEAVGELDAFINEARAEGHSDDEIESAIGEAMIAAGYDENDVGGIEEPDEFEEAKMSAYVEGSQQAIEDVLESDLAKEAGITLDDLAEYELGGHFGAGYAETRAEVDQAIQKIAAGKAQKAGLASRIGKRYVQLLKGGREAGAGVSARRAGNIGRHYMSPTSKRGIEAYKSLGTRVGTAGAGAGATYGGYKGVQALRDRKKGRK